MTLKLALDLMYLGIASFEKVSAGVFPSDSEFVRVSAERTTLRAFTGKRKGVPTQ